ncbi:MAG: hypothetical protein ABI912_01000 [Actinomycetota bacterium]
MTEQWPNTPAAEPELLSAGTEPGTARGRGRGLAIGTACLAGGVVFGVVGIAAATNAKSSARTALTPAAQAQSATPSATPSATAPEAPAPGLAGPDGKRFPRRGGANFEGHGPGGMKGIGGGVLHGEFVTPKPGGGYQTIQIQRGTATAVTATSITVKSADGFSRSYAVDKDTLVNAGRDGITSIAVNDAVDLRALGAGDKANVADVVDETKLKSNFSRFAPDQVKPSADASKSAT